MTFSVTSLVMEGLNVENLQSLNFNQSKLSIENFKRLQNYQTRRVNPGHNN